MFNHAAALKLLEQLGPDHPNLKQALAALDVTYHPPQKPEQPTKKVSVKTITTVLPLEPQVDFSFPITVVTKRESKQEANVPSALTEIENAEPLVLKAASEPQAQPFIPLWQEKPLYQVLLPYFHREKTTRQPDIDKITQRFVRKQPLVKLPNRVDRHTVTEIWLYCDYSQGASVYHRDYQQVRLWLKRWFGDKTLCQQVKLIQRGRD
ncbi:MAG: hypothetical protein ACI9FJ_003088, partial [Alteromonadaceae bacterium]